MRLSEKLGYAAVTKGPQVPISYVSFVPLWDNCGFVLTSSF